jgi:phage-related protein
MVEYTLARGSDSLALTPANGFYVRPGVEGLDTPPVRLSETDPADSDGSFVTNVRYAPRDIVLPLHLQTDTPNEVRGLTRRLASLLNPQVGPVTLTVRHPVATAELLPAAATDGRVAEWEGLNAASAISEVTTPKRSGTYALQLELSGTFNSGTVLGVASPAAKRVTVSVGQSYEIAAYARAASGTQLARLTAAWYTSGGTLVARQELSTKYVSSSFVLLTSEVTPPFGATRLGLEMTTLPGAVPTLYWDDITVTAQDVTREISGYLSAPFGAALAKMEGLPWRRLGLQLRCPDPFFVGPSELAIGQFADTVTVYNPGDAFAWPVWTAIGATGFPLEFTNTSLPGNPTVEVSDAYSSLTIDTNPRSLSVINNSTQAPAWDAISSDSTFFPLAPGDNIITGANIGGLAYLLGTFRPRWLTGW